MIFGVLKFPKVRCIQYTGEVVYQTTFRWRIYSATFVPKITGIGQLLLKLSSVVGWYHECVAEAVGCVSVESIICNKLNSKFADLYSSYHVAVKVNANDFSTAIDILNAPDSWPSGALVRRYFKPRNG